MEYALGLLLVNLLFAVVMAEIANSRGRTGLLWGAVGLVFGLFGLIALLLQKNKKKAFVTSEKWTALKNKDQAIEQAVAEITQLDPSFEVIFAERLMAYRDTSKIPEIVADIKSGEYAFWKKIKKHK